MRELLTIFLFQIVTLLVICYRSSFSSQFWPWSLAVFSGDFLALLFIRLAGG
jgi:hypothetical protein